MTSNRLMWTVTAIGTPLILLVQYGFRLTIGSRTPLEPLPLLPGVLYLNYIHNTNEAFALFSDVSNLLLLIRIGYILFVVAVTSFISWRLSKVGKEMMKALQLGLGLLLAGAISNIAEKIIFDENAVFINIQLSEMPVFNLADVSIYLGQLIAIVSLLFLGIQFAVRRWRR